MDDDLQNDYCVVLLKNSALSRAPSAADLLLTVGLIAQKRKKNTHTLIAFFNPKPGLAIVNIVPRQENEPTNRRKPFDHHSRGERGAPNEHQ